MDLAKLAHICQGTLCQQRHHQPIQYLLTDSRKLISSPEAVFFALAGVQHDGHHYLEEVYRQGVRQFVVKKGRTFPTLPEANILQVDDVLASLQCLAKAHREASQAKIIAITGSNGKTIVKEWLGQLLSEQEQLVRSPKSYNSQLGVALSLWQLNEHHSLGIFEAGISLPGEMLRLERMLQPHIGIFTNLGSAHDQGFSSRSEKLQEKLTLFEHCQAIVYCADQVPVAEAIRKRFAHKQLISWSLQENANAHLVFSQKTAGNQTEIRCTTDAQIAYRLPFTDAASLENILHCLAFFFSQGYDRNHLQENLSKLHRITMRLEVKAGTQGNYLIDDTYNNDLAGLEVALDFMQQQPLARRRCLILSDMQQTGLPAHTLYKRIAKRLQLAKIDQFIGIGPELLANRQALHQIPSSNFFATTEDFLSQKNQTPITDSLILLKGARSFAFERIVNRLQQKNHGTVLEINLDSLTHNLNFYRSKLKPGTKLMVMVKAFAYGNGSHEIARLLAYQKVDYLAVAYADEGVTLRKAGVDLPIMVMNPAQESFDILLEHRLEPEIYSLSMLQQLVRYLEGTHQTARIHIKLDTGMHRLGFTTTELPELRQLLQQYRPYVQPVSIFSHLAGSDSVEFSGFSHEQAGLFQKHAEYISAGLEKRPIWHLMNSAGILRFPEYHFDMVRLGIGLYGAEVAQLYTEALQPISTLKTTISQIKEVASGKTIGYSRRGTTQRQSRIATIAIGYADGYDRRFSNGVGRVIIQGKLAPIIGNVCMDMTMVDITDIPHAQEGDEVIIFGPEQPITELADQIGTIPYEILTNVSERVKRIFYTA